MTCPSFPEPPQPVSATFTESLVTVTFDQDLVAGSLDASNWTVHDGNTYFQVTDAEANGQDVALTLGSPSIGPGAAGVSYDADPPDVVGDDSGLPAGPFTDFPFE